jgi:hypothetical protein
MSQTEHFWELWIRKRHKKHSSRHTSFQRCFEMRSTPVIGSMKTSFATRVSGIQIAQRRWTHSPWTVCLNAPPSFGQRKQDYADVGNLNDTEIRNAPQDSPGTPYTFDTTIVLLGYMELHNNLKEPGLKPNGLS